MFWPARSGLAFFFGLRCAGGTVAIVVLSFPSPARHQPIAGMCLGVWIPTCQNLS
jgi:hypothetical protein